MIQSRCQITCGAITVSCLHAELASEPAQGLPNAVTVTMLLNQHRVGAGADKCHHLFTDGSHLQTKSDRAVASMSNLTSGCHPDRITPDEHPTRSDADFGCSS
ncbi:MAG: hypothetical protein R3B84_02845 [Zavarzinella sp.]